MAQPLALGAQLVLVAGSSPAVASTSARELGQPRLLGRGVARQLVVAPPRRRELAPGGPGLAAAPQLLLAAERVEHVELVRGSGEPALLELAGHRDQPLGGGGEVLARDARAPTRRRASARRAKTRRASTRPSSSSGASSASDSSSSSRGSPAGSVELGLDVGLARARPDGGGIALRAEQQPERLREDRLARAGLAGDRVQPGRRARGPPRG